MTVRAVRSWDINAPIRLRVVTKHWLLYAREHRLLPDEAKPIWPSVCRATVAVVAYQDGQLVGFVRWFRKFAQGTWVAPELRRSGLAMQMWDLLIKRRRIRRFHITTVSEAGRRFVQALTERYPDVDWSLEGL